MPKNRRRKEIETGTIAVGEPVAEIFGAPLNGDTAVPEDMLQAAPNTTPEIMVVDGGTLALERAGVSATEPAVTVNEGTTLRTLANLVTFEVLVYALVGAVALLLRIASLENRPLAPFEAQTAAAAWEFLNGQTVGAYSSPLLFTLDWLSFVLFGASDWTARILPALLGTLLVFIPLLVRGTLGRLGAVVAATLIAFSPTIVFFARALSGVELAAGGALAASILFYQYRHTQSTRALYAAAFLAAASLTADAVAFTVLIAGGIYLAVDFFLSRINAEESKAVQEEQEPRILENPLVRAAIIFVTTYVLIGTTFLLNRDGLGVAFNLLGEWFSSFSGIGGLVSPLNWLIVYEPLPLIFGMAGLVLVFTLRGENPAQVGMLRMFSVMAAFTFVFYTFAAVKSPGVTVAIALPLILLAGWFVGNLLERARDDIAASGGAQSTISGELPVLAMMLILAALVYVQVASFLQNTSFSPALDALYDLLGGSAPEASLLVAGATLGFVSLVLLGVFVGLSILLIGVARTTTLMAVVILVLLSLGMVRATWQLAFPGDEPVRELLLGEQTPLQVRDLLTDVEFYSQAEYGDSHVIRITADPQLGAVGRWYLRRFPNLVWTSNPAELPTAQAVLTPSDAPPAGDWMGRQYQIGTKWEPTGLDGLALWKWFVFREGGSTDPRTIYVWLPTIED
jgi:uncharacterized protein (TIGR03663 family)